MVEPRTEEGHVAGAEDRPLGRRGAQTGVDACQRPFSGVFVDYGGHVVREVELGDPILVVGDDDDFGCNLTHSADYATDKRFAVERLDSLVSAESTAHSAGEYDCRYV